jgi:predicted Fe-S protein YdhL (DUF1289 family)
MGKNQAAAKLAREKWKDTTPEQRAEIMSVLAKKRWNGAGPEDKEAVGKMLAAARKRKRKPAGKRRGDA